MDSKVGVVLGFSAVSVAEMLGYLVLAATENSTPSPLLFTQAVVIFLSLGFLAGILACLVGFFILVAQKIQIGPEVGSKLSLEEWTKVISRNEQMLANKAKRSTWCIGLVLTQMTCYGSAAFVLFLKFAPIWGARHNYYTINSFPFLD